MMENIGDIAVGEVSIGVASNRGLTPVELLGGRASKLVGITDPAVVHTILVEFGEECVASHKTTLINKLNAAGFSEAASFLGEK